MSANLICMGVDLGTGGARAVAMDFQGRLVAEGRADFPAAASRVEGPCVQQDPLAWRATAEAALRDATARLPARCEIVGIAVDATSGTFLLCDEDNRPLTPGVMYNDMRAAAETPEAADAVCDALAPYGIQVATAFALPKLLHFARHEPAVFRRCRRVVHQTDWIVGALCGRYDVSDVSTALKTGVDPASLQWPEPIEFRLGIPHRLLPEVVLPGTPVGHVTAEAAAATGLPAGVPVVAGATDGIAGCLASGAKEAGDVNLTLGTTLTFKAISPQPLLDPDGVVYNHRHPAGGYLPGAASSTGAEWVEKFFRGENLERLGREAAARLPTRQIVYPLVKTGERFPFACTMAAGFGLDEIDDPTVRFAAGMEGTAFLERLGIERLEQLGLRTGATVYATGGAVAGETWLRVRAAVSGRTYSVPRYPQCAVGAAVLAAMPHVGSCREAVAALVRPGRTVEPEPRLAAAYVEMLERFRAAMQERGWL